MSYGVNPQTGRCRQCGKLQVRPGTDGRGNLLEYADPCPCPKVAPKKPKARRAWLANVDQDRRRACICQRCDEPVVGKPKVALYCEPHRLEARREAWESFRAKVGPEYQREKERI